jgi:hypothetical protein
MGRGAIVVGSGWAAHAARAFAADERVELLAIVGRGSARTRSLARSLNVPAISGLTAALRVYSPEVAVVAAASREHPSMVRALLHHGSHVMCSHPVAGSLDELTRLGEFARERGLVLTSDYTLRETKLFGAAKKVLSASGVVLRAVVTCPARAFAMGIDLALAFAGPARRVDAFRAYPSAFAARARAKPSVFAPTLVLEHKGGCVTTIVPTPHAEPRRAFQVTLSTERARIELGLPSGGLAVTRTGRKAVATREVIPPEPSRSLDETFALPMKGRVGRFLDAICNGRPRVGLQEETAVRDVWEQVVRVRTADA